MVPSFTGVESHILSLRYLVLLVQGGNGPSVSRPWVLVRLTLNSVGGDTIGQ
jgi:hypothetical protein